MSFAFDDRYGESYDSFSEQLFSGSIDCIHGPVEIEADFVNRKADHSLNVQMTCDPNFRITSCVAKWPRSVHVSRIFRDSNISLKSQNVWGRSPFCQVLDKDTLFGEELLSVPSRFLLSVPASVLLSCPEQLSFSEIQQRNKNFLEISFLLPCPKLGEIFPQQLCLKPLELTKSDFFLLVLLVLFQKHSVRNKYHKSCRKYNSLYSILYLLWQSGDIELNPGPARSTKYRQWLKDACVSVHKGIVGVHSYSKSRNMWKEPPNFWSPVDAFFDPNNSNHNVHEIENLLSNLISCGQSINIEQDIEQEIWLWKKDYEDQGRITNILPCEDELLKKYDMRKIMKKVEIAINSLKMNSEDLEIEIEDKTCIIEICFHPDDEQTKGLVLRESEAVRRLSCLLFRIYNDKDPDSKSDKIWVSTNKPVKWSKDVRFYNPNNGGKREKHGEDKELLGEVIKCIERKNIEKIYQNMISAWKTNNIELLSKLLDFQKARASLKAEVKTMVEENLLDCMRQDIERLGLSVSVKNVDKKRKHTEKSQRENKRQKQSTSQSCSPSCSSKDELLMIDNSEGDNTETDDWTALKSTSQSCIPSCSSKDELLMFDNTAGDNTETDDWTALKSTSQSCSPSCSSKDELLMFDNSAGDNTETDDWTALKSTSQSCNLSFSSKDELLIDNSEGDNTETDDWTALKGINWNDKGMEDIDIDFWNAVLGTDRQFFKCCE